MIPPRLRALGKLASLYGVQSVYHGAYGQVHSAPPESILAALRGLGARVTSPSDAPAALSEKRQKVWQRQLEPVTVAWNGHTTGPAARLPRSASESSWQCRLTLESGEQHTWACAGKGLPSLDAAEIEGSSYVVKRIPLPGKLSARLPWGYHQLSLEIPGLPPARTLIVSAPTRAFSHFTRGQAPAWGAFLPLYALRSQTSPFPSGDFSSLKDFSQWTGARGGSLVATLPILPAFLDQPCDPSPYAPVSRLLWNEFYLDISRAPELEHCPEAQAILASDSFRAALDRLRQSPLVYYREEMALKRQVLELLSRCVTGARADQMEQFLAGRPEVEDYARFRAVMEKRGEVWHRWPQRLRDGDVRNGDYEENVRRYHAYAQWLAQEQVRELSRPGREGGAGLYLDLPLGVHPEGYDAWRRQDLFVPDCAVGAPPDPLSAAGQNWGFSPIHPENLRESGYDYYIAYLRHHFAAADLLRIDHVMGLHRLFWIPQGMDGSAGLYVRYPHQEAYAILGLESHRNRVGLVGEDLGTVPPGVRPAMRRHGLQGMHVAYFQMAAEPDRALNPVAAKALASVNTHDLPPFASFWRGLDIACRQKLAQPSDSATGQEFEDRSKLKESLIAFLQRQGELAPGDQSAQSVLGAVLAWLGRSPAPMVLVNLEDLWLETQPQNIPGTGEEYPNWRHKARYSLEEFGRMPRVIEVLDRLNTQRKLSQNLYPTGGNMANTRAVSFHIEAPNAKSVGVSGDFNGWNRAPRSLRRRKDGIWWGVLRLSPGVYQYKFLIDGTHWQEDPANPNHVPNDQGTHNSVLEVA
jgi:4-alpha-glucanotransferase